MGRKKSGLSNLVLISQLGITVMTPVFLCTLAGVFLDRRFGTKTVLIFLILGVLSGGLGAYKMAKQVIDAERREEEKKRQEQTKRWTETYGADDGVARKEAERLARLRESGLIPEPKEKDGEPHE